MSSNITYNTLTSCHFLPSLKHMQLRMCTTTISTILLWLFVILLLSYVYVVNLRTCDGELLWLHIAVTDVPLCLWNTGAPLAGNTGFICPLSRSVSTKESGWLHNLWATNCVVNQYLGPLYASRHQTLLWRRQHIYSVQFLQTAQSLLPRPSPSFICKYCIANAPDHTAQPVATSSPQ